MFHDAFTATCINSITAEGNVRLCVYVYPRKLSASYLVPDLDTLHAYDVHIYTAAAATVFGFSVDKFPVRAQQYVQHSQLSTYARTE